MATQLIYWRPLPSGPPTPRRNGGSIRPSTPPAGESTMPKRSRTTRIPAARAGSVAASHSRPTSVRKSRGRVERGAGLGQRRVAAVAVDADRGRRDEDPRRPLEPGEGLAQEPSTDDPALDDAPAPVPGPADPDRLAREMYHRIEPLEAGGIYPRVLQVPGHLSLARTPPHERNHLVPPGGQERCERAADEARCPGHRHPLPRAVAVAARGPRDRGAAARAGSPASAPVGDGSATGRPRRRPPRAEGDSRCGPSVRRPRARRDRTDGGGATARTDLPPVRPRTGVPPRTRRWRATQRRATGAPTRMTARPPSSMPPLRSTTSARSQGGVSRSNAPGRSCQANTTSAENGSRVARSRTRDGGDGMAGPSWRRTSRADRSGQKYDRREGRMQNEARRAGLASVLVPTSGAVRKW